jgi:predicted NBD/HSP70 family sugar kinase
VKILGIDIGGTALKWGMWENGRIQNSGTVPSYASLGAQKLLDNLFSVLDGKVFDRLGVSTAGMVAEDGSIRYANENIPNYTGVKLRKILEDRYGVPVSVLNDISAAAYSEAENYDSFYYLALGTGVGGVYVRHGEVLSGYLGIAGQIGYLPAHDGGFIDSVASTRGLNAKAEGGAKALFAKAEAGCAQSESIIYDWCGEIAHIISHIVGFINPPVIIIGGGISEQGDALLARIEKRLDELPEPYRKTFELKTAKGGNYAAVQGVINYIKEKKQ